MGSKPHCYTAGDHTGMTEVFHLIIIFVLATICIVEIVLSIILTIKELPKKKNILNKFKLFMVPLIVTDFLIGCTFVLLFVLEVSKKGQDVDCDISIPRILMYMYYFATRTIALMYICFLTYRKTKQPLPTPTLKHTADGAFTFVINISMLWSPGISALLCFGFSSVETNSILASITFIYFIMTMSCTTACHFLVYRALNRNKSSEDNSSFTDTKYYRDAIQYVQVSFFCFVAINAPLFFISIVFVGHTFVSDHSKETRLIQDLYLVAVALTAIESIGNPLLFVRRINNVKKGLCKTCSIIIFRKKIEYGKSFSISFKDATSGKKKQEAPILDGDEFAENGSSNGGNNEETVENRNVLKSIGEDEINEMSEQELMDRLAEKRTRSRNVTPMYDEAGIEIEAGGCFDRINNDITLAVESIALPSTITSSTETHSFTTVRDTIPDIRFDVGEPQVFGDWRNHALAFNSNWK